MKLYHGSRKKLKFLKPQQATGIKKLKDRQIGIYATENKEKAIIMTLIHLKGIVGGCELKTKNKKIMGVIYGGGPTQNYFYLYEVPKKEFSRVDSWQWISKKKIRPVKIIKLKTKDYIHKIKIGSNKEKENYLEKIKKFKEKKLK